MSELTKEYFDERLGKMEERLERMLHDGFLGVQVDVGINSGNMHRYMGECLDNIINTIHDRINETIIKSDSNTVDINENVDMTREQLADHITKQTGVRESVSEGSNINNVPDETENI